MGRPSFSFDFPDDPLRGKTVLVAGGTGGLGSAAVALLAREGARVVAGYRSDRERAGRLRDFIAGEYGAEIELVEGDIGDPRVRENWIQACGPLYGLACFTGDPARVKFADAGDQDLHHGLQENYVAPLLLARDAASAMRREGAGGAIVFVSSMQAVAVFESSVNYAGGKAALLHATRILAKQWGGRGGIRVNAVAPGVTEAGMALASIASGKYDVYVREGIIERFGRAEDVARLVRLLLEPDNYVTGQVITVDGGLTLRRARG